MTLVYVKIVEDIVVSNPDIKPNERYALFRERLDTAGDAVLKEAGGRTKAQVRREKSMLKSLVKYPWKKVYMVCS